MEKKYKKSIVETLLKRVTELGIREEFTIQQKRSVILSNFLALIFALSSFLLLLVPQNFNLGGIIESGIIILISITPLALNYLGFTKISRPYLCWVPVCLIMFWMIGAMQEARQVEVVTYDGLRIYLLALSCVPYLLFESNERWLFITSVLPSLICIFFFDSILNLAGVGYSIKGVEVSGYHFSQMRLIIAYFIINGSCFSLKLIISNNDRFNKKLLAELNLKNQLIKTQSESELKQLNEQLLANLEVLEKRELALSKSQQLANIGSWEYEPHTGKIIWSDEMYDIFGLDKSFDLGTPNLMRVLFGEAGLLVDDAYQRLIKTGEVFDFTFQTRTPIGYMKWVRVFGYPIVAKDEVVSVNGIVHDVTIFKESEELLKANERNYRSLFEQASDAIVVNDFQGNIIDANGAMTKLIGYSKAELLNLKLEDIHDPEELAVRPLNLNRLLMGDQVFIERILKRKDHTLVNVEVNAKMIGENKIMGIARDISERIKNEKEREYARYLLNERIKELTTLYRVSQLLTTGQQTLKEVLTQVVNVLPGGWQHTKQCAARITCGEMVIATPNFKTTPFRQFAEFGLPDSRIGLVEIVYLEDKPEEVEGPFLFEERNLINVIAEMLQIYIARKHQQEALNESEANLRTTINNTEILIWSVDREFKVRTFNKPFEEFIRKYYDSELTIGSRVLDALRTPENLDSHKKWERNYLRALSGEVVVLEETVFDIDLKYSLSPIIEGDRVIGVSVFADNVTERNARDRALAEANKKIGEFRLTALRSVMNPHFIFNALNSVQFFITKNDRLNALNYLSTFSKLIRGILTNSVTNTIKLSEELELLKHYINLEMLRFENKFTFQISIDDQLDLDSVQIPSLLVQPYVENAILHGLYNKSEAGMLTISVKEVENAVLFEIEDNGIGREAAARVKAQNFPKHKSMGTALTEERLRLINDYNNVSLETLDLMDGSTPIGTRVRIWIKV